MMASGKQWRILTVAAMLGLMLPSLLQAKPASDYFDQTGQSVDGPFLTFWKGQGALPVFGYPITPQRGEANRDTGAAYETQWFERNRFELHPENRPPYDILLGRLGDDRLLQQGIDWRSLPREAGPKPNCLWFPATSRNVCDQGRGLGFKSYWETHGLQDARLSRFDRSLQLFGLPLTEPRVETNTSGDTVLTQWFERARFEWHPDEPDQYKVLLGLLGSESSPPGPGGGSNVIWSEPERNADGFLESKGNYANDRGQRFEITVEGQSRDAIVEYTSVVRVNLSATASRQPRHVMAFYYPWWEQTDWSSGRTSDMPAPTYSSGDDEAMRRHIQQADDAGIDALVCAWYGPHEERLDSRCRRLLQLAQESGRDIRVAIMVDPASFVTSPTLYSPDGMVEALNVLQHDFMSNPAYFMFQGKPAVFFWQLNKLGSVDTWQQVRNRADPNRAQFWFGDPNNSFDYLNALDAAYFYEITRATMDSYGRQLDRYNQTHNASKPFIATVEPGYDDFKYRPNEQPHRQDRANGAYYRATWQTAIDRNAAAVVLTSFNEFHEGTHIEPSASYGDLYLRLTREGVDRYQGSLGTGATIFKDVLVGQPKNLAIDLALAPEQARDFKEGYEVVFDIDPPIDKDVTHDYMQKCRSSVSVVITAAPGSVEGVLYREGTPMRRGTATAGIADGKTSLSISEYRWTGYDLAVIGKLRGNRYRVTGSWHADPYTPAPGGGGGGC